MTTLSSANLNYPEIWHQIFTSDVLSIKDVVDCRLVCKRWSHFFDSLLSLPSALPSLLLGKSCISVHLSYWLRSMSPADPGVSTSERLVSSNDRIRSIEVMSSLVYMRCNKVSLALDQITFRSEKKRDHDLQTHFIRLSQEAEAYRPSIETKSFGNSDGCCHLMRLPTIALAASSFRNFGGNRIFTFKTVTKGILVEGLVDYNEHDEAIALSVTLPLSAVRARWGC